jgi:uncharacterized membrane protein
MRQQLRRLSLKVATTALIASMYSVMTVILGSFSYSWVQVRVSEALTPLPYSIGFSGVAGLTLGCFIANLFSPVGLPDVIFGPLLTLCAALLSWKANFGRKALACVYPVLVNAFGVSAYVALFYDVPYMVTVLTIGSGEFIAAVLIGYPLMRAIDRITKG